MLPSAPQTPKGAFNEMANPWPWGTTSQVALFRQNKQFRDLCDNAFLTSFVLRGLLHSSRKSWKIVVSKNGQKEGGVGYKIL